MDNKTENELPKRKRLRLESFDHSTSGAYFITICTKNREMLFAPVGADVVQSFKRYSTVNTQNGKGRRFATISKTNMAKIVS